MDTTDHGFPCDACGSDMRFDPARALLICDYCGNETQVDDPAPPLHPIRELDFRAAIDARLPDAEIETSRVTQCPNCGAQIELGTDVHAIECPFCATPVVIGTGEHRHIKPRGVLPFALDEAAARAASSTWSAWFTVGG